MSARLTRTLAKCSATGGQASCGDHERGGNDAGRRAALPLPAADPPHHRGDEVRIGLAAVGERGERGVELLFDGHEIS